MEQKRKTNAKFLCNTKWENSHLGEKTILNGLLLNQEMFKLLGCDNKYIYVLSINDKATYTHNLYRIPKREMNFYDLELKILSYREENKEENK